MADKEREERVRRRDQIRKLQERLSNMEQEKRTQAQEMRKMFQEKIEMEEKGQKGQMDIGRKERHTDPVRRSLTFDKEAEGVDITRRGCSLANADLSNLRESSLANADLGHLRESSLANAYRGHLSPTQQNTTEQTGVVVRRTYTARDVTSTEPKERVDEQIDSARPVTSTERKKSVDEDIGSSSRNSMSDLLDHSLFRHEMSFDDQESAKQSISRTHTAISGKQAENVSCSTPDFLYGDKLAERSIEKPHQDDLTSLKKQVRKESDAMSITGDQDKSILMDTPSIQRAVDEEEQRAEQRRKALLEESARLKREREMLFLSIKKERKREDFLAKQRLLDEQIERERSEMRELMMLEEMEKMKDDEYRERMLERQRQEEYRESMLERQRQEEEYREKMLEKQRQMLIEERDREDRKQREMMLDRLRNELDEEMHERQMVEQRLRQEKDQERLNRELAEEHRIKETEEMFERTWRQKKDSVRKEMTMEQLQEERQLLEEIHLLKIQKEDIESKSNSMIAEERLSLLRKEREELLDKCSSGRQTTKYTVQDSKNREKRTQEIPVKTETSVKTKPEKTMGKPKLPAFDGSQFEAWKMEVVSLTESPVYSDYTLTHIIRNSIEGKARKVLLTLKPTASTAEILKKMEDIYGNIRSGDAIVQEFYSARQMKDEPCSEWGIRLETLFNQAVERGEIQESRKDAKLKERFWRGLVSEKIKVATRSAYESTTESFDRLRRKARIEELEIKSEQGNTTMRKDHEPEQTEKKACMSMQNLKPSDDKVDRLRRKIELLETSLDELKARERINAEPQGSFGPPGRGRYPFRGRGGYGPPQDYERYQRDRGGYGSSRGNGRYPRDGNSSSRYAKRRDYEEETYPRDDYSNSRYFYSKRDQKGNNSSSEKQQKSKN